MNKQLYKIIFSKRLGTLVAVGEHATSAGKAASGQGCRGTVVADGFVGALRFTFASVALACLSLGTQAQSTVVALASTALPQGASVSTGSASVSTNGAAMAITQTTDKASINWQSFNVGTAASVNIAQPSASAVLLNRVVGNDPSQILGQLKANGQVILLNPNGVVFGKDGSVTASSFTASTFGLSDADFMAGYYKYNRNGSTAAVVNQGTIETSAGGFVALIGATVTNEGTIRAPQGDVVLVAAESVTLPTDLTQPQAPATPSTVSVRMSKRVRLELDPGAINTAVNNTESGVIVTEGGQVLLQAAAISSAVASVTHSGRIDTSAPQAGAVTVLADNGVIKVDGSITANSSGTDNQGQARKGADIVIGRDEETGVLAHFTDVSGAKLESNHGFVETSGDVLSTAGTRVKAGEWLLDPYNITIAASSPTGTAYASNYTSGADSTILASDISANLTAGTSVTIATGAGGASVGNIAVNESIAKTGGGDATLTLQAHGNINVAAGKTITSDTGKLNVVFNSDSDALNGGAIVFATGAGITSNGGNITLGGGTALNGTGFAIADGVSTLQGIAMYSANINAGGGNISMKGKTAVTNYVGSLSTIDGIYMTGGAISTTGSGTIDLSGHNQNTDTQSKGIELASGTITGGSTGAVTIVGDSRAVGVVTPSSSSYIRGALINNTTTSTGGNINITGYGGSGAQYDYGVDIGGSVIAIGSGAINITGTAGAGGSGGNVGVITSGAGNISSVNGAIAITGTGGIGNGSQIRDHGVFVGGSNAVRSTGTGDITVTGTATNADNGYSQGVVINAGGLNANSGTIKIDGTVPQNYQVADYINAPITSTSGNIYIRSTSANIQNTTAGTISGNNVSIDNTGGTIDANGVITKGLGGASTWASVIEQDGIKLNGSVTAANNLNVYGNQTGAAKGVNIGGATTTVSGKNVTLYGNSNTGNGVLLTSATLSGEYLNVTGKTAGSAGFALQGGAIKTTGTTGTSTASIVKGISTATGNTNGYGAFMLFTGSNSASAAAGTTLTLSGEATNLAAGVNTNERGIFVQGGYTLAASGDITLDGSSKSSEGIAFGGTINMATVAGVTNKLTIKGTAAASSNNSWNAINFSGAINGNAATSSINFIGDAKNLSGANKDNAVNISGAITGGTSNVNIQSTGGTIVTSAAITGANISIDNTNGTINSGTGAITTSTGTAGSATGISIGGNVTATGNLNLLGVSTGGTGINFVTAKNISGADIQATGKTTNGAYGILFNGSNAVTTTGISGDSQIKGMTTAGGTNALLAWGGLNLTSATGTTLTLWGDGTSTGDRAARFDGGVSTNGAVTLKGTSNNATSLMLINGVATANVNSALSLIGTTSGSGQAAVYFVNGGGVSLKNGATLNVTGQSTSASGLGTGVSIQGAGIYKFAGATSTGAVSITGSASSTTAGAIGVYAPAGIATDGNIDVQGNVSLAGNSGVHIASSVLSSGTGTTINIGSNYSITNAGSINVSGANGTGASINLTSTNRGIWGTGTIGDTTNKNASVTFTQSGTSTYDGAINAANFTKAGTGALTLDSWAYTTPVATNISNAYTVKDGGTLSISPGATYAQLNPASVNVENASTFSINSAGNGYWKNTAFNFTGGNGGGIMNLAGNPIGASATTNTFTTSGGATNTVTGMLNANNANVNFNIASATSGTALLDGSFAALAFTQNAQGGFGLQSATTVNMTGGGNLLFKDKVSAITYNINAGNVQVGDGSAVTSAATATLDATNISIAAGSKLTFNRAEAYSNASTMTGAGSLIQAGAGTLTLTGNSSAFAGATTVNAGKTLAIGTGGSLGAAGSNLALADIAASLLFTEASGTSIVGSTISGAGSLSHTGAGAGVLTADNSYSGATSVSGGILQIGNATSTGTLGTANTVTLSNNATLAFKRSATTTIDKAITGDGNVTANITGITSDLTLASSISLTGSNTIDLAVSGSITETQGSLAATNLYMTTTGGSIGAIGNRIQSNVTNLSLSAGGDVFLTEANAVTVASRTTANNGNIDIATTNGTMTIGSVNSVNGITANGTGNITLSGTTDTGHGIYIGNNITASSGTVSITGTTSTAVNPDAGVRSAGTVTAKNITLLASATNVGGGALGYFGAGGYFNATEQLNLTGTTAGTANGFYSYTGGFASGTGTTIIGTSTSGQGVGLVNGITMTNGSTGNISITGTATDGTKQGIGLRGIAITNGGGNTVLTAVNGVIATDSGNPAWNTGLQTNTITSNGTGSVQVVAGNGSATNSASIDGTVFAITQNSNAGVLVSTSGTGNVTAPKVTNNGTGNVVVAAGSTIAAGTGTGGQVLAVTDNTITNNLGTTYIYSGAAGSTGVLSYLSTSFNELYYQGTSHAVNTGFNTAFDSNHANDLTAPAGGNVSSTQVFFRSTTKPGFGMTLANLNKSYGDADPTLSATNGATLTNAFAGVGGTNTFAITTADVVAGLVGSRAAGENTGTYAYTLDASGFNTVLTAQPNLVIGKRNITLSSIVAANKTYDGTGDASITSATFDNMANGESLLLSGSATFSDKYAADGKTVTVADITALTKTNGTGAWSNYNLTSTGSRTTQANIAKANLTVTASQVTKTYDGGLSATGTGTVGALAGAGAGDTIDTTGTQIFIGSSDAGTGKTVRASGLVIKNASSEMNDNYNITYVDNTTSVINKATLTVAANADAKFVTQTDAANYKGVNYSGFVAGQDNTVLGGTLAISRTNSVTDVQPGSYAGSLVPTGLISSNYDFHYVNGNYTILPAAKLLVTTTNQTVTYGTTPTYTTTAEYLDNHNQVISMLSVAGSSNNQYTFTDGVGGTVTLALKPYTGTSVAAQSASGNTVVGNYAIQDLGFTQTGNNFNGTPVFLGTLTVAQKGITPSFSGISKVYDGSSAMGSLSIQMGSMVANDALSISGTGAFNQKNVGTSLGYTVTGIGLSGNDASNYYLVGATNTYSGTDGAITAKALTLAGTTVANKTFDGNTNATITAQGALTGLVGNETVTLTGLTGAFDTAAVGTQKMVALSGSLGNGLNGGLASNYSLGASNTYADITTANNNGGNGGNGGSKPIIHPPKPIIPTDNTSEGGGGSNSGGSSGNPYSVMPSNRNTSADRCTPNSLEDCLCETQEPRPIEGLAICYQPKKTASATPAKGRRG